jgi:HK97 family phage major capsid protein
MKTAAQRGGERLIGGQNDRASYLSETKESVCYRFGKWLFATIGSNPECARYCRDNGIQMQKATSEATGPSGGFLVPDETEDAILALREAYGVIGRCARTWPLKFGGQAYVPRRPLANGSTASWITEGESVPDSDPTFDNIGLTMRKLGFVMKMSEELEEDAIAALSLFIIEEVACAFAYQEDQAGFYGTGASIYGGICGLSPRLLAISGAVGNVTASASTYGTLTAADIGSLIGVLPSRALPNARLFMSMACYSNTIIRLAATSGGLVAKIDADGNLLANFSGFPIEIVPSMPSSTGSLAGQLMIAAGDMRQGIALGRRRQITIRRLAERFADVGLVAFKATERVDINVHDLGDANAAGALVGLFGA